MDFLWTFLIGFIIALAAHFFLMPGKETARFKVRTRLGVIGSFGAVYIGQWLGWYAFGSMAGFISSAVGAIILLAIAWSLSGKVSYL